MSLADDIIESAQARGMRKATLRRWQLALDDALPPCDCGEDGADATCRQDDRDPTPGQASWMECNRCGERSVVTPRWLWEYPVPRVVKATPGKFSALWAYTSNTSKAIIARANRAMPTTHELLDGERFVAD